MCGRITLTVEPGELARAFAIAEVPDWVHGLVPRYNIAPSLPLVAIRREPAAGERVFARLRWGLVPFWAKDPGIGMKMINARSETVAEKPAFRQALARRRCLIPVDGFFEWRREGKRKQPYWFHAPDGTPLALAGLWERWEARRDERHGARRRAAESADAAASGAVADGGVADGDRDTGSPTDRDVLETCTILTTGANALMAPIHHRMPVILSAGDQDVWLGAPREATADLQRLLVPCPAERLAAHPVTPRANRPSFDEPAAVAPLAAAPPEATATPGGTATPAPTDTPTADREADAGDEDGARQRNLFSDDDEEAP